MSKERETVSGAESKVRIAVGSTLTLMAAAALMGSVDVGSTSRAMRGEWEVHVDAAPTECDGSGRRRLELTVSEEGIVVSKPGAVQGEGLRAVVDGQRLRFDVRYTKPSGVETLETVELHLEDGLMTGTSAYTEIRGADTCSATATVLATR